MFSPAMKLVTPPPVGSWNTWCHLGVMAPGLPDPHRFFTVMSIVGTPGVAMFDNDPLIRTGARDTAYLIAATASMDEPAYGAYSVRDDCAFSGDGSRVRFGSDLALDGVLPSIRVRRSHPDVSVDLRLEATDVVTVFFNLPGIYRHWSVLCRYTGTIVHGAVSCDVAGLCTYEYATGVGTATVLPAALLHRVKLPGRFFTYQVLNVDETTQVLLTCVRGPAGLPIMSTAHIRSLDGSTRNYRRRCSFSVDVVGADVVRGPDGVGMVLPEEMTWQVRDRRGVVVLELTGRPSGDWHYGLGRGYAGSFAYGGRLDGREIVGTGYMEYIDL